MTIPTLPTAPSPTDTPSAFNSKAFAFLAALNPWATAADALSGTVNAGAATAIANAATASAQASIATDQAAVAQAAALNAGAIAWVSGTTYSIGDLRYSPIDLQSFRRITDGAGVIDPSLDSVNWTSAFIAQGVVPIGGLQAFDYEKTADLITYANGSTYLKTGVIAEATDFPAATSSPYGAAESRSNATSASELGALLGAVWPASSGYDGEGTLATDGVKTLVIFTSTSSTTGYFSGGYSTDGMTWTGFRIPPVGTALTHYSITYGGGLFCVVCSGNGSCYTSPDGLTWTAQTMPVSTTWAGVAWGNGVFVAVASANTNAAYSTDGITWVASTNTFSPVGVTGVQLVYGVGTSGPMFVCTSASGGGSALSSSPTGETWSARTCTAVSTWTNIAYGDGVWLIANNTTVSGVRRSVDGITWTAPAYLPSVSQPIHYLEGVFYSYSSKSIDGGVTWTSSGYAWVTSNTARWVMAFSNGLYCVGIRSTTGVLAYSIDGTFFELGGIDALAFTPAQLGYANGWFFSANSFGSSSNSRVLLSKDGLHWFTHKMDFSTSGSNGTYGAAYFLGKYWFSNNSPVNVISSTNLRNYDNQTLRTIYGGLFAVGTKLFVVSTQAKTFIDYTEDGIAWGSSIGLPSRSWEAVFYANSTYLVWDSTNSDVYASSDGVTWAASGSIASGYIRRMYAYQGGFLAVSSTNVAYTSTDGAVWTLITTVNNYRSTLQTVWAQVFPLDGEWVSAISSGGYFSYDGVAFNFRVIPGIANMALTILNGGYTYALGTLYTLNDQTAYKYNKDTPKIVNDINLKTYHTSAGNQTDFYKRVA